MSKGGFSGKPRADVTTAEQLKLFANLYRQNVVPAKYEAFVKKVRSLGLDLSDDELTIMAALDTPTKVQEFLNTQIYYNWDHAVDEDVEETAMPPHQVLQTAKAHCFEGAMFAYAVNYLHGHEPRLVMLEASQDSEHNLVPFQDPHTKLYGANAHSAFPRLDGRPPEFATIQALAESYYPYYYSDRTFDSTHLTLVGYSEPFDLTRKFGVSWMASDKPLWDIYCTYVDDTVQFHYLFDGAGKFHLYPLVHALKEKWIRINTQGKPFVDVKVLPKEAQSLWEAFWAEHQEGDSRAQGKARVLEQQFRKLTSTTPLDLIENADELQTFLERGYRVEQLLTRSESESPLQM